MEKFDLSGKKFGKLLVIKESHPKRFNAQGKLVRHWICKCDCGKEKNVAGTSLKSGNTRSCGCWWKSCLLVNAVKHSMHKTKTYKCWANMKTRCGNPNVPEYKNYGGRGIRVCERWEKFENFLADMGEIPEKMTIERKNNDLGYSPENCCWATRSSQLRNRRNSRFVEYQGRKIPLAELAEITGFRYRLLLWRLDNGKDLFTPIKARRKT